MRIAYNVWYDHCRRNKTEVEVKPEMMKTSHDTLNIDICQALAQLKEEERTCITLQLIDGYSISEIANITRMPENTVKSHLKRGKEKTANYLRENGYDRR